MAISVRKIKTRDLWLISRILLHMRTEVTVAIEGAMTRGEKLDWEQLGLPIVFDLLEQADTNLSELLAGMGGMSIEEFADLDATDTADLIAEVVTQVMEDGPRFLAPFSKMLSIRAPTSTASNPATAGPTTPLETLRQPATSKRRASAA